jgi:hypothetical protein
VRAHAVAKRIAWVNVRLARRIAQRGNGCGFLHHAPGRETMPSIP